MKIIVPRWRGHIRRPWGRVVLAIGSAAGLAPTGSASDAYSTPAMTVAAGNTVIAVRTWNDGLRFYWNQYGTSTRHGEQVAVNGMSVPAIAADGNGVNIAVEGLLRQ